MSLLNIMSKSLDRVTKSGYLFKLGDGPINFSWNQRYIIVDRDVLYYYAEPTERTPRGMLQLTGCTVSPLHSLKDHQYSFTLMLGTGKRYHFSHLERLEAEEWRQFISLAAKSEKSVICSAEEAKAECTPEIKELERKGSIGELPPELSPHFERLKDYENPQFDDDSDWKVLAMTQGMKVEARNWVDWEVQYQQFQRFAMALIVVCSLSWLFNWSNFVAFPLYLASFWLIRNPIFPGSFDYIRAVTIIDASPKDIFSTLMDLDKRRKWDSVIQSSKAIETLSSHVDVLANVMVPHRSSLLSQIWKPRVLALKRYWMRTESDVYMVVMKSTPQNICAEGQVRADYYEGVSIRPLDPGRCKVTFLMKFDPHSYQLLNLWMCKQRISSFSGLREYVLHQLCEDQAEEEQQITEMADHADLPLSDPQVSPKNDLILYGDGEPVSLERRNPGYTRNKAGGIVCVNKQELDSQKGIVLELLAKAGKQLMEGKNIVGISLPVRIFEARSTLERMVDWWCTAPVYLANACLAVSDM